MVGMTTWTSSSPGILAGGNVQIHEIYRSIDGDEDFFA